ncbi:MAG: 3-carboxy-cis,cis-muconate cycloisomerase [Gordonia sp.]|uniref:lyase family protein n=1 Tax=Gordonia sp. (in: high G+C Gram-positive bacteria) TaxID=84139 RepID=UPI000C3617A3|nr:lyase family protein [Gordonia sp. (in: high G+C Gram-positive bacteria)]MAU82579.1 3-carboxy-cis,cis-muconate cycloisomerase [Gordonia sp. (in: high G+C Gram-positive bacteria)]
MSNLLWPGEHHAGDYFTDSAFLDAMLRVEAAWSVALAEAGVAPPDAAVTYDVLRDLVGDADLSAIADDAESGGNPVIPLVKLLRGRVDTVAVGRWLHRGLTSQDVVDTAVMRCAADASEAVAVELERQARILADRSDEHRHTPMVARTLTQHAVPTTFGLKAAMWLRGVLDAREQVAEVSFAVQLGGAGGTSAAVVELAGGGPARVAAETSTIVARELGLEATTPWHGARSAVTRIGDAAVTCTDSWAHIGNDVLALSRPEIGELTEGAGGGSSTMPHKSNPVLSVLIRRAALAAPPLASSLHLAAVDTVDERTPGGWHVEWDTLRTLLRRTLVAARQTTRLVDELRVHTDRMAHRLAEAGDAVTSEQTTMAEIAGHTPAGQYLGAADFYIDAQLERLRTMTRTP